jgi:hypothetical protein
MCKIDGTEVAKAAASGGIITIILTFFFGKRKAKVDLLREKVETMVTIITGWEEYSKQLNTRLIASEALVTELQGKVVILEARVKEQDRIISQLRKGENI